MTCKCPECGQPVDLVCARCTAGHVFPIVDGVVSLLSATRRQEIDEYLRAFERWREHRGELIVDPQAYRRLPVRLRGPDRRTWRLREIDLNLVRRLLRGRRRQRILDVGAWNGWLSQRLSMDGHEVLAIDYFVHPCDGLRARKHYPEASWAAVQMDLEELPLVGGPFDVVIFNRGLPTFTDPAATFEQAKNLLDRDGLVVATGLNVVRESSRVAARMRAVRRDFETETGRDLFFKPMKTYLRPEDVDRLRERGMTVRPVHQLWPANLRALVQKTRLRYMVGFFARDRGDHAPR